MDSNDSLKTAIVVADDEELVRKSVVSVLKKAGFEILSAENLPTAIGRCRGDERAIDLAVIDAGSVKSNPGEVAQRLREMCPHARLLFLADAETENVPGAGRGACRFILRKPFRRSQLLAHVLQIMDQPLVQTA